VTDGTTGGRRQRAAPRTSSAGRQLASRLAAYQSGGLLAALIALCAFFSSKSSHFATHPNFNVILLQVAIVGLVAVPGAMLVLSGYVDLSVGSVAVLAVAVFGSLSKVHHTSVLVAALAAILVGALWGLMNGVLITYLGFSPIIVTLGGFAGARGLAETITHDVTRFGFGSTFGELGNGTWQSVPIPAVIFLGTFLLGTYLWYEMPAGRHLTSIGADRNAARALGVSPSRLPCLAYIASGACAAVGGLILTSELDGASLSIGVGLELQVLTAILLGGVAFNGGRGSLWGVLFGVFFVGVLNNGLVLMNIGPYVANLAVGIVLGTAAAADAFYQRLERVPVKVEELAGGEPPPDAEVSAAAAPAPAATQAPIAERPVVLSVQHATKRFGPVAALRDVSLELRAGEVLGLIGDNGAGKSTLVSIMSGTLRPDEGQVLVDGIERRFSSPSDARDAGIETVFQSLALIPTLNIAENVFLKRERCGPGPVGRTLRRMQKGRMHREVRDAFDRFGVTLPPLRSKVSSLSGGQRQAVAITRAVMWGSHIVIMDEPAAALGVRQTELVLSLVERLRAHGVAIVFISHNMQQVLRVADRVAVMRLGQKVADVAVRDQVSGTDLVALMTGAASGNLAAAQGLA
jgi:ribose/xylose/arabinose/galactoside ABC-type transport system permease subunit/ABC-type branched-subunit amino acid transport system ATPase component